VMQRDIFLSDQSSNLRSSWRDFLCQVDCRQRELWHQLPAAWSSASHPLGRAEQVGWHRAHDICHSSKGAAVRLGSREYDACLLFSQLCQQLRRAGQKEG